MVIETDLSRRAFLEAGSAAVLGPRFGERNEIRVHVGYAERTGRRTTASLARSTVRDFSFDALTVEIDRTTAVRLARRSDVRYVEPVRRLVSLENSIDNGIDRVDADVVHEKDDTGSGAHVGVVDSGIDKGHPALSSNLGSGKAFRRAGFFHWTPWDDDYGHGTHCAGVIGASDPAGIATDSTLHAVKVLNGRGEGTTDDLAAGIQYVADQGWSVANLSVGTKKSQVVSDACSYAAEKSVTLVAAAGPKAYGYPAREPECLSIGAATVDGSVASFSPTDGSVDLLAPGTAIRSTEPDGYGVRSGTSMAAAHVSGTAALLAANGWTRSGIEFQLRGTAEDIGTSRKKQGAGMVDVAAALGYDSSDN